MKAYASAETAPVVPLRALESSSPAGTASGVLDDLLAQLADLVADRIASRLAGPRATEKDEWLDTRRAAEYLGIHRDSLRRLAAERAIPTEQAGAGCKHYFKRSVLEAWRCSGPVSLAAVNGASNG
ncbi:MAG: helix-turn-helix domain-containing protein [Solirubrobacteraceae bacterium]